MKQSRAAWLLTIVVLVGAFLRCQDLLAPFENGHRGSCAAFFSLMAANHLRYGLATTLGVAVLNPVKVPLEYLNYYLHHPPGAVWIATLGANLGGSGPAALRMTFLPLSLGIIILILRLARSKDMRISAFAAGLIALAPITVYYGAFVNFEIPTLFFSLLALHLFLRYQRRGRQKDRTRFVLAQAAAVFCDWIAIGLPLMLLLLAPLRQKKTLTEQETRLAAIPRPFARIAAAGLLASVVVGIAVKLLYHFQIARFGQDPQGGDPSYYLLATPLSQNFSWESWRTGMATHLNTLIPAPLPWFALGGLAISLWRAVRRRLRALDIAALATTAIAIANVIVLGNHAYKHDYYLLYAAPAVALSCAILLRALSARFKLDSPRTTASRVFEAIGIVVLAVLLLRSIQVLEARRNFALSDLGAEIAKNSSDMSVVFVPASYTLQVAVRADRFVYGPATTMAEFEATKRVALQFGVGGRPLLWLNSREQVERIDPAFKAYLEQNGTREERGPFVIYDLGTLKP